MNQQEWNKCFIWLAAMFPQWNTSQATSAVWYEEIKQAEMSEFKNGVRFLMDRNPSPFPPGVFEIKAIIKQLKPAIIYKLAERKFTDAEIAINKKKVGEILQNLTKTA